MNYLTSYRLLQKLTRYAGPGLLLFFCCILHSFALAAEVSVADYDLKVSFDPSQSKVAGKAIIRLGVAQRVSLDLEGLRVSSLLVDGKKLRGQNMAGLKRLNLPSARRIEIIYSGRFNDSYDHGIFPGTVVLTEHWFPVLHEMMVRYRLKANLPKGFKAVSEGDVSSSRESAGRVNYFFKMQQPLPGSEGIGFIASNRYQLQEEQVGNVLLRTLLTHEMAPYAVLLMEQAKKLLAHYQTIFGPYPFKRLTLAEAPTSSSLSYPGYILLNRNNIKELPADLTMAHEIVHEWFGNGVFISWGSGNWAEGAAIYFADHALQEGDGKDWACRRKILTSYHYRAAERDEFPLLKFQSREDALSRWIGYGKGAFVYHALRRELGDELFMTGIRNFLQQHRGKIASFTDLQQSFELVSSRHLDWFFKQWVAGIGLPALSGTAEVSRLENGHYRTTIQIMQKEATAPFHLKVPVQITTTADVQTILLPMNDSMATIQVETSAAPSRVVIDPDYDLPRRLPPEEQIPTIGQLESEKDLMVLAQTTQDERFAPLLESFKQRGVIVRTREPALEFPRQRTLRGDRQFRSQRSDGGEKRMGGARIPDSKLAELSLAVMGREHPVLRRLFGTATLDLYGMPNKGFSVTVLKNPLNLKHVVAVFDSSDRVETVKSADRLGNYGGYSSVIFSDGKLVEKKLFELPRGINLPLEFEYK